MTNLIVRIDLGELGRIGPGKIHLLEMIAEHGSISAAGRAMGLPYRHAWELVEQLNSSFREPVVARQTGGRHGGGASLTPFGEVLLKQLVGLREDAEKAAAARLAAIDAAIRKDRSPAGGELDRGAQAAAPTKPRDADAVD